jgi:hypothetical protein
MTHAPDVLVKYTVETISIDEGEKRLLLYALRELLEVTETDPCDYNCPHEYDAVMEHAQRRARYALKMLSAS